MKIIESKKSLIGSLLFLFFGALIFAYPNIVISTAAIIVGVLILLYGIFTIIKNYYETKHDSNTSSLGSILGITSIIVGILFIVLASSIAQIVQYILGAWIIFIGIERLIVALSMGKSNNQFVTQLVIAILLLSAGIYTLLRANLPLQIVGLVMMIYAVLEIIGYITNKKDSSSISDEINTKLVISDKKSDIVEEVKDAVIVEEKEEVKEETDTKKDKKKSKKKKNNKEK